MTQTAQQMKNFLAKIADIRPNGTSVVAIEHEYGQWCCWHFSGFRPFILCLCCAIGNWTAFKLHRNEKYMYGNNNEMSIQMHFSWYERGFMRKPLFSCSRHFQWPLANDVNGHKRAEYVLGGWWNTPYLFECLHTESSFERHFLLNQAHIHVLKQFTGWHALTAQLQATTNKSVANTTAEYSRHICPFKRLHSTECPSHEMANFCTPAMQRCWMPLLCYCDPLHSDHF